MTENVCPACGNRYLYCFHQEGFKIPLIAIPNEALKAVQAKMIKAYGEIKMNEQDIEIEPLLDVGLEILEDLDQNIDAKQKQRRNMEKKLKRLIAVYDDYPESFLEEEHTTGELRLLVAEVKRKMRGQRD